MSHLERISLKKDPGIPLVVIREHLLRYVFAIKYCYDKDVLDLATGSGYGIELLSHWAKTVTGFDYSNEAIDEARENLYKCPAALEIRDLEKNKDLVGDKAEKYGLVTVFETLEHLENPEFLLENISNHLNPKGVVLISVPNQPTLEDENEHHKQAFNIMTLSQMLNGIFQLATIKFYGEDQLGMSYNLSLPYLFAIIETHERK